MKAKRGAQPKPKPKSAGRARTATAGRPQPRRTPVEPAQRKRDNGPRNARVSGPAREQRPLRHGPATTPVPRPARPKNASQAKARAKARKAKAPKIARIPLRQRVMIRLTRLAELDLSPKRLVTRIPFVVLVIGALGIGLGVTLWLSTDAAERSYQLGHARQVNQALLQQKEALEREVLEAQAAPALAEAARNLGMIPSRDTAHLVQDPTGNWVVVGNPKPAEGVPPPPLNVKLPDPTPPPANTPTPKPPVPLRDTERSVPLSGLPGTPAQSGPVLPGLVGPAPAGPEVLVRTPQPGLNMPVVPLAGTGTVPVIPDAPAAPAPAVPVAPAPAPAPDAAAVPAPAPADIPAAPLPAPAGAPA